MSLSSLSTIDQYSKSIVSMKNKQVQNLHFQPSVNQLKNSREEQAFADDGEGPFGGFVWPPRSYACSFCKREFRSAQALGGHMNVHRRDRARLKQSLNPQNQVPRNSASDVISYPSQEHPKEFPHHSSLLKSDCVNETNLGASSNFFISQNQLLGSVCDEEMVTHKRHKASTVPSMPFFVKPSPSSDGLEDLDLELRLGDSPKVK